MYQSETSKVRHLLKPFFKPGMQIADIGFGGDKVVPEAIGIDFPEPYARTGFDKVDIPCDVSRPIPVKDATYDIVYSSHLIEDFKDTQGILRAFIRLLKPDGLIITVIPDEQVYRKHCVATNQPYNSMHQVEDMGLAYLKTQMDAICDHETLFESSCEIDYNVILVSRVKQLYPLDHKFFSLKRFFK